MNLTLPDDPDLLANVGAACRMSNLFDQAAECLNRSLAINLVRPESWNNYGQLCEDLGNFSEAMTAYTNAFSLCRDHPAIALALAYSKMRMGEWSNDPWLPAGAPSETHYFMGTWDLWEFGRAAYIQQNALPGIPMWNGEDLAGNRLLITPEGGFGDYIWLSRYLPKLVEMVKPSGMVWVLVPDSLGRMSRNRFSIGPNICCFNHVELVPNNRIDYQTPLLSLLSRFLRDPRNVSVPALQCNLAPRKASSGHFTRTGESPLWVGLCSAARENGVQRPHRSIPLAALDPLREVSDVEWVSLMPDRYTDWMHPITWIKDSDGKVWDWEDTACVIEQLDLVVSVDTAILHLAGSLGVPVWALIPMRSDHKWALPGTYKCVSSAGDYETSVWYPGARLFRQQHPTDWSNVIQEVCGKLAKMTVQVTVQPA